MTTSRIRQQALFHAVLPQAFLGSTVQDFLAFPFAGAVDLVHQMRGLQHAALLVDGDAGIVQGAGGGLDLAQEGQRVGLGRAGRHRP